MARSRAEIRPAALRRRVFALAPLMMRSLWLGLVYVGLAAPDAFALAPSLPASQRAALISVPVISAQATQATQATQAPQPAQPTQPTQPPQSPAPPIDEAEIAGRLEALKTNERALNKARAQLEECESGCLTPSEAVALAFSTAQAAPSPARVLLDIEGGGQSVSGNLNRLFFINSQADYAQFGTLTIAFEAQVLNALLRRARSCGGGLENGAITVQGCRQSGLSDVNMFTMMQRLLKRRILVDGDVRLQWIDWRFGARNRTLNTRGEREKGYYQPWIWVTDADQITFVYDD